MYRQYHSARTRRRSHFLFGAAAATASLISARDVLAAAQTNWNTNSANWNTAGNWTNGVPTTDGELAYITEDDATNRTISYNYNGAAVTLGQLTVSNEGSGTNSLSMTTAGLVLISNYEFVGGYVTLSSVNLPGNGSVTQSAGTNTLIGALTLGDLPGSNGAYNLSAAGLITTPSGIGAQEIVGGSGAGVFTQTGGNNDIVAFGNTLFLGENSGSTGTYVFTSGTFSDGGLEFIGYSGVGLFNQSGGTHTLFGGGGGNHLEIGETPGSTGTYILSGTGTIFINGPIQETEDVGLQGVGIFNQTGGSNTVGTAGSGLFNIGAATGAVGTYTLSGGLLTVDGYASVAGQIGGAGGTGSLAVSSMGRMVVTDAMNIYVNGTVSATNEFVGGGSASNASIVVGPGADNGTITQKGGSNTVTDNLQLGVAVGTTGTYTLTAGSLSQTTVGLSESIGIGGTGIFNQSGGMNTAAEEDIANSGAGSDGVGTYNLSGGTDWILHGGLNLGVNATDKGTFILSGTGTLSSADGVVNQEIIGGSGIGLFNQSGGSNAVATIGFPLLIGENTGSTGTYVLSGGLLSAAGGEYVGFHGTGNFNQSGGTNFINGTSGNFVDIGFYSGQTSTYTLSGSGLLSVSGTGALAEYVGDSGAGIFTQTGGTNTLAGGELDLGDSAGGYGQYVLTGGALNVGGNVYIAGSSTAAGGSAIFVVADNGQATVTGTFTIFNNGGVSANFEYIGSVVNNNGGIEVGPGGNAGMVVQSGGLNIGGQVYLGNNFGTTGTYTLSGSGSLSVGEIEDVGVFGVGLFNQSGGSSTINDSGSFTVALGIGYGNGSTGTYLLSNTATLTVAGNEWLGGGSSAAGGTGIFNQSGGTNTIIGPEELALGSGSAGAGTYILSGTGTVNAGGSEYVGFYGTGIFNQSGGLNHVPNFFAVGEMAGSTGSYTLSGGTLTGGLFEYVGDSGSGSFNQSGGANNVATLDLARLAGSTGTYVMTNGTLNVEDEDIGVASNGTFNQSGGLNAVGSDFSSLIIGVNSGVTGTYNLTSTGSLTVGGFNSYEFIGYSGTGIFNQTGGSNTTTTVLFIAYNSGSAAYTLSGGVLSAPAIDVGGSTTASGGTGTLTIKQTGQLAGTGSLTVWNSGRVNLDVPATAVSSLTINGKGIVNLNGTLHINYGSPGSDPVTTIAGYLTTGYNGGNWSGTAGIISTSITGGSPALAVGYADGNTDPGTAAGPNQIVVKYTLAGDTNLDGLVNFNDLVAVVQNFNKAGTDWAHGDFHFGTSTNFNDLVTVVQNFNKILPPPSGAAVELGGTTLPLVAPTDVQFPEPGELLLLTCATAGLLARRRRAYEFKRPD
jgi:hypothetical protein